MTKLARRRPRHGWDAARCARMLLAASCVASLAAPRMLAAQTILNTERFQLRDVAGPHLSVDGSVNGGLGNARFLNASAAGMVGHRGERHWPRLIAGGQLLSDRERRVLDDRFLQVRYGFIFSDRTESFHFWQLQSNRSLLLRRRMLLGSGVRRRVLGDTTTTVHVGTGLMYEAEDRNPERLGPEEPVKLRTWRLANQAVARHTFATGATLLNILYFQPEVADPGDFRLLNELGLTAPITEQVSLTVASEWRHDSRPPAALRRDDLRFRSGLRIDFR